MERIEQLLNDSENRMNTIVQENPKFKEIVSKYNKQYPNDSLGQLIKKMEEEEKKVVFKLIISNLFPVIDEFFAEKVGENKK